MLSHSPPVWSAKSTTPRVSKLRMVVDSDKGIFTHQFDRRHNIVRQTDITAIADIESRLQNGTFLFNEGALVDYRNGDYKGFAHSQESIARLIDELGFASVDHLHGSKRAAALTNEETSRSEQHRGGKLWGTTPFQIPGMQEGGQWEAKIAYTWDPFTPNIRSLTSLVRLICTNGMTTTRNVMDYNIPIVSNWTENLEIAYRRLRNKLQGKVIDRLERMPHERASVSEVQLLNLHATSRLNALTSQLVWKDPAERAAQIQRARRICDITNVSERLAKVYTKEVFNKASNGAVVASDITSFDALNLATEIMTHVSSVPMSTNSALTGLANNLLFSPSNQSTRMAQVAPQLNVFSNADDAFMAAMA